MVTEKANVTPGPQPQKSKAKAKRSSIISNPFPERPLAHLSDFSNRKSQIYGEGSLLMPRFLPIMAKRRAVLL